MRLSQSSGRKPSQLVSSYLDDNVKHEAGAFTRPPEPDPVVTFDNVADRLQVTLREIVAIQAVREGSFARRAR